AVAALLIAGQRAKGKGEREASGINPSPNPLPEGEGEALSPASRAQENKINASDPGVASRSESGLTPGYSMSRLQRDDGPASRAQENKKELSSVSPSPNSLPAGESEGVAELLSPASRAQENKKEASDPGVARSPL